MARGDNLRDLPPHGRPKGSQNKTTVAAKAALEQAFTERGGVTALKAWADKDPSGFYALWGKLLPKNVELDPSSGLEITIRRAATGATSDSDSTGNAENQGETLSHVDTIPRV